MPNFTFDGYDIGYFTETDTQQTDTYGTNRIPRWYGSIVEEFNKRTQFVKLRMIRFDTLANAIFLRFNSLSHLDEHTKRELKLSEAEYNAMMDTQSRYLMNTNIMSGVDPRAIITVVDRYAWAAPSEIKIAAAVEYAVWTIRQPVESNKVNGIVRSGAATLLDPYKHRGI